MSVLYATWASGNVDFLLQEVSGSQGGFKRALHWVTSLGRKPEHAMDIGDHHDIFTQVRCSCTCNDMCVPEWTSACSQTSTVRKVSGHMLYCGAASASALCLQCWHASMQIQPSTW